MLFTKTDQRDEITENIDKFNDSYTRDVTVEELKEILDKMDKPTDVDAAAQASQLAERLFADSQASNGSGPATGDRVSPGWLFKGLSIYFHSPKSSEPNADSSRLHLASTLAKFGGATIVDKFESKKRKPDGDVTHVVVPTSLSKEEISSIRTTLSKQVGSGKRIPHLVTVEWVEDSWKEKTLLDEESMHMPLFLSAGLCFGTDSTSRISASSIERSQGS
jgi:DNA ligase-4